MATLADRILGKLKVQGVPLDDDDLAARLGVIRQSVNQVCRRLAQDGVVRREVGKDGKIVNRVLKSDERRAVVVPRPRPKTNPTGLLTEDAVKQAVKEHLEQRGYAVQVAWAKVRGIDIDARKDGSRVVIEAKGAVAFQPQQVNYFLGALGELIQRMDDQQASYGLALPDNPQYRGLVSRLPKLAKERLGLAVYFVRREGEGLVVDEVAAPGRG